MTTIMIWDSCGQEPLQFFEFNKDLSALNDTYINSSTTPAKKQDRLTRMVFTTEGKYKKKPLKKFPLEAVNKKTTVVIVCGMLP